MIQTIDEYKLNMFCVCLGCKHRRVRNNATRYCKAYPQKLPPEIWNGKDVDCQFFEAIQEENQTEISGEPVSKSETGKRKCRMKRFSDLIKKV